MAEADALHLDIAAEDTSFASAGEKLRRAREQAGIDRAALSALTKINERHLEALEAGDFAALPARIYAVGFARTYARAVGLDELAIAGQVRQELIDRDTPTISRPTHHSEIEDPARIPSSRMAWVAGFVVIALIIAGAIFWRSALAPAVDLPPVSAAPAMAGGDTAVMQPDLAPTPEAPVTAESAVPPAPAAMVGTTAPARAATTPAGTARQRAAPAAAAPVGQQVPSTAPSAAPAPVASAAPAGQADPALPQQ